MRAAVAVLALASVALRDQEVLGFGVVNLHHRHRYTLSTRTISPLSVLKDNDDMQVCLEKLDKRVKEGKGALSDSEIAEIVAAMERIENEAKQKQEEQAAEERSGFDPYDEEKQEELLLAVSQMDSMRVAQLLDEEGLRMSPVTTQAAFWAIVNAVDTAERQDLPLSADVPRMLHRVFEADQQQLRLREKISTNVTCMQPDKNTGTEGAARRMNYIFDDADHKNLPLTEGRVCEGGTCCDACSRNIFPTFASEDECDMETFPELCALTFNDLEKVSAKTILQFSRLVERVRRTIAYEYGLPLKSILPLQAYSRKYVAGTTQQGGGGGEGDFVTLHTDEATHSGYHYSCVLYLSTQGEDFEGGNFVFNDPAPEDEMVEVEEEVEEEEDDEPMSLAEEMEKFRYAGRKLTPFAPTRGAAVIFSSGWENMHEVDKITSGIRYVVPCFFTTCPVPEAAYEQMHVGKPQSDEDIADDWLHLLLAHRKETPIESVGRVKELLMKWHTMHAPLNEH